MRFRKRPVEVEATQWFQNGDHPEDKVGEIVADPMYPDDRSKDYKRLEGLVVRFFRRPEPEYRGTLDHELCGHPWHVHGWIDTLEGGHTVCPSDWIITHLGARKGEHYPCKADIFAETYEAV